MEDWREQASIFWGQTSTAMMMLDEGGMILAANPAAAALFGHPVHELVGCSLSKFLDLFSRDKAALMLAEAVSKGSAMDWELDVLTPETRPKLALFSVDCLKDPQHFAYSYVVLCRDFSPQLDFSARLAKLNQELEGALLALEKAHRSLKETQAQLVQSEKTRSLGQLVAGIAHEINNPLGFVKNNANYVLRMLPKLDAAIQHARFEQLSVQEVKALDLWLNDLRDLSNENLEGLSRIEEIVKALRNFSRLDEADYKLADVAEGLNSTIQLVRGSCQNRIVLDVKLDALPVTYCHPGELNQVFMNLLVNAIQAIPEKGVIIIRAWAENQQIWIAFQDTGVGMPPEVLPRLGEPFFTTKPPGQGIGLGLAVSMGIVKRHNGQMSFTSQTGQGTRVTLQLPVKLEQENER